jgi:hypothetical protein
MAPLRLWEDGKWLLFAGMQSFLCIAPSPRSLSSESLSLVSKGWRSHPCSMGLASQGDKSELNSRTER